MNYVTSRAAHLVKQSVSTHHSGKEYRDQLLDTVEIPLHKKQTTNIQATPVSNLFEILTLYLINHHLLHCFEFWPNLVSNLV